MLLGAFAVGAVHSSLSQHLEPSLLQKSYNWTPVFTASSWCGRDVDRSMEFAGRCPSPIPARLNSGDARDIKISMSVNPFNMVKVHQYTMKGGGRSSFGLFISRYSYKYMRNTWLGFVYRERREEARREERKEPSRSKTKREFGMPARRLRGHGQAQGERKTRETLNSTGGGWSWMESRRRKKAIQRLQLKVKVSPKINKDRHILTLRKTRLIGN